MFENTVVRAGALAGPLACLRSRNVSHSELLKRSNLTPKLLLTRQSIMSAPEYLDILARCEYAGGTPHFMLQSGLEVPLEDLGIAAQVGLCSDTLGDALSFVDACLAYLGSGGGLDVSSVRGRCQVRYKQGLATALDARHDIEYTLGGIVKFVCNCKHARDPNLRIYYPNARSNLCLSRYGSPQFIDSTEAMVEFDAGSLNCPMLAGCTDKAHILTHFMYENRIDDILELSMRRMCESLIECSFEVAQPSQHLIASMLGLNVRSMQRHLKAEGAIFREILACVRQRVAMKELRKGSSITEVAIKLGYEHPQNFATAFDKWFGSTPSAVRSGMRSSS